jgi:SAM-dependent methyltransferase
MPKGQVPEMPRRPSDDDLQPSVLVSRFGSQIVNAAGDRPILDVACGSGRNAQALSRLDATVICVDKDLTRLRSYEALISSEKLKPCQLDLERESWPFGKATVGGIINVHFLLPSLFSSFKASLFADGFLLIETVPGCGGNYLQLPRAGELRSSFADDFDFLFYRERKVGPPSCDAVTVQLVARRRSDGL